MHHKKVTRTNLICKCMSVNISLSKNKRLICLLTLYVAMVNGANCVPKLMKLYAFTIEITCKFEYFS